LAFQGWSPETRIATNMKVYLGGARRLLSITLDLQEIFVSDEFLCVRCAKHYSTCCQGTDIFVTLGDVRRMTEASSATNFTEFRPPADPAYDQTEEDPFWQKHVFRSDGKRRVVKHQPNGDCHFLGPQGCTLASTVRPLICRLYPFDYTADGLKEQPAGGCPVELLRPQQKLLQVLGMDRGQAEQYRAQLYVEIVEHEDTNAASESAAA